MSDSDSTLEGEPHSPLVDQIIATLVTFNDRHHLPTDIRSTVVSQTRFLRDRNVPDDQIPYAIIDDLVSEHDALSVPDRWYDHQQYDHGTLVDERIDQIRRATFKRLVASGVPRSVAMYMMPDGELGRHFDDRSWEAANDG